MTEALTKAQEHSPALVRDIEDAILNVAARPSGLRGPWHFDEAWLQQAARNIRRRRSLSKDKP